METEYTCEMCGVTFQKLNDEKWNDAKAEEEMRMLFGEVPEGDRAMVCDDCFQSIRPDRLTA